MPAHPDLAPLEFLLGTWEGAGRGVYPTIDPFGYHETVAFTDDGRPFLAYSQRTFHADTGERLHAETGYLRPAGPGRVETLIAQMTGVVEAGEGTVAGSTIHVDSTTVGTTATAKSITRVERRLQVAGDVLRYELSMEAVGQPHQIHLTAELRRR